MTANDNIVVVTGISQTIKQPDSSHLKVTVFSRKPTAQDASQSVQRRVDYVLQVLRLHGFDKDKIISRTKLEEENKTSFTSSVPDFNPHSKNPSNIVNDKNSVEFVCSSEISAEMEPVGSGMTADVVLQRVWETHNVQ